MGMAGGNLLLTIILHYTLGFPAFGKAVRLIALLQVSSCAVERVFSQLQLIKEVCGSMIDDCLEVRLFARCNGDLDGIWTKAFNHDED